MYKGSNLDEQWTWSTCTLNPPYKHKFLYVNSIQKYLSNFQQHGISWWLLCQRWISESFWNVLEWNQICHWLVMCILYQADYILYFCVALLYVCETRILQLAIEGRIHHLLIVSIYRIGHILIKQSNKFTYLLQRFIYFSNT